MKMQRKGFDAEIEKDILTIRVDLSKDFGASKSSKSLTVASSEGNIMVDVGRNIRLGLNVFKPNPAYVKPVEGLGGGVVNGHDHSNG